ncbi:hypothetical protein LXA43DRAFT_142485 [Ganoderma leucocontextum]|nr:hypothetical protein LXA43DRAFT_142485 [Ganoderma leucocontextum]
MNEIRDQPLNSIKEMLWRHSTHVGVQRRPSGSQVLPALRSRTRRPRTRAEYASRTVKHGRQQFGGGRARKVNVAGSANEGASTQYMYVAHTSSATGHSSCPCRKGPLGTFAAPHQHRHRQQGIPYSQNLRSSGGRETNAGASQEGVNTLFSMRPVISKAGGNAFHGPPAKTQRGRRLSSPRWECGLILMGPRTHPCGLL